MRNRKDPNDKDNDKNMYTKPLYKDLSARSKAAAESEIYNELFDKDPYYDDEDDVEESNNSYYTQEQMKANHQ